MGTVHLLEAVRTCPSVRAAVIVTTDKCYENKEWVWGYRENEPMGLFAERSNYLSLEDKTQTLISLKVWPKHALGQI